MGKYEQYRIIGFERYEIKLFNELSKKVSVKLTYSYYSIRNHKYKTYDHKVHRYFNIKYTILDKYLVIKGDLDGEGDKIEIELFYVSFFIL